LINNFDIFRMSYDLILPGLTFSFKTFVSQYYDIKIKNDVIGTFKDFLESTGNPYLENRKEEIFEYFIYQFLAKNEIISCANKTFYYINEKNIPHIPNDNVNLHGQYGSMIFLIRIKW
jgi:hypothetical protein